MWKFVKYKQHQQHLLLGRTIMYGMVAEHPQKAVKMLCLIKLYVMFV